MTLVIQGCASESKRPLRIAVASNIRFAIDSLASDYEKLHNVECEIISGASGKLASQINMGAPFDIYISANKAFAYEVVKKGKANGEPSIFTSGRLVLWSLVDSSFVDLENLSSKEIQKISIPNPVLAPYGAAGLQVLQGMDDFQHIEPKLVYGESVFQTTQHIHYKSAQVGITALSMATTNVNNLGFWKIIPESLHDPIHHYIVKMKASPFPSETKAFEEFLFSPSSQLYLQKQGYSSPLK